MEKEGFVSLWLGEAETEQDFWKVLEVSFSEDGDFLGSEFSRGFGIEYYEDTLREAEFIDDPHSKVGHFLNGASYEEVITPKFHELNSMVTAKTNCLVLLYNYQYVEPQRCNLQGVNFIFAGSVSYIS